MGANSTSAPGHIAQALFCALGSTCGGAAVAVDVVHIVHLVHIAEGVGPAATEPAHVPSETKNKRKLSVVREQNKKKRFSWRAFERSQGKRATHFKCTRAKAG